MPKPGWMAECNADVLQWASRYEEWRERAIKTGEFPAVIRVGEAQECVTKQNARSAIQRLASDMTRE